MVPFTKEDGKMEWCMVLDFINGKMGRNMKAIMSMVKSKEMVSFTTVRENNMLECGQMVSSKAKGK